MPRVISFSGSDRVGRHVGAVAASHLKRTVLELSGNSALVVLADADVDYAVDAAVFSRFVYQGQVCMAANRILVDRSVEAEFTEKFTARVRALRTGDPREEETDLGPVISDFQADALSAMVDRALAEGATALVHGRTLGNLVEPTVLAGVPADSALLHQEIFGPVVVLVPFDGDDEAVRIANDTPYGLSGAVHTADAERGVNFAHRVETGMIHVNDSTVQDDPQVAFGGEKASGSGFYQRRGHRGGVHHPEVDLRPARPQRLPLLTHRPAPSRPEPPALIPFRSPRRRVYARPEPRSGPFLTASAARMAGVRRSPARGGAGHGEGGCTWWFTWIPRREATSGARSSPSSTPNGAASGAPCSA